MSRLTDLETLRADLIARMAVCESDQNFSVLGNLLTNVLKQVDECRANEPAAKGTALDEFTRRRQQAAGSPSPAKRNQRG